MRMDAATESGWTNESEEAFQRIKRKLSTLQTLTILKEGEDLMLCLRQRNEMVSSVLMVEREGVQTPVSYVNMDDPNITMEEYIMLEEEKARRCATVFDDAFKSEVMLSCEPTVSPLNDNKIDFRIPFDEFADEDYMPKVSYFDDLDDFKDFEKEFPAIIYNDALTSKLDFLTGPTVSSQHIDEFNLKDETSLSECDEEEQNVLLLIAIIIEYLVKISKKARILELKRRHFEDYCSEIQYVVSIKEDTAYLCLDFTKDHKGTRSNTPYPEKTNTPYSGYGNKIFWKISNVVPTLRNPQYAVMVAPTILVSADSFEGSFGDTIDIGVDVIRPVPIAPEELRALRDRVDVAEAESASLRATIRTMGVVKTILHNRIRGERQTRIEIERQLASV
ncbi:hypothetical protein Tco_0460993 [Tanacetum coccineum]